MNTDYTIVVTDTDFLTQLCGTNDSNLRLIEEHLGVSIFTRGNELFVSKADESIRVEFKTIIDRIARETLSGAHLTTDLILSVLQSVNDGKKSVLETHIQIPGGLRRVYPKTANQAELIQNLRRYDLVFCAGPAGSGKTFLAVAEALYLLLSQKKRKIILTRPVVEAGESLGFLPGDFEQKLHPYLRPLYDSMEMLLPRDTLRRLDEHALIEIAPLAYMRGRTLTDCVVILDEAQNTTREQMKLFLSRMGENTKMIITGDITQVDLPRRMVSGMADALNVLRAIEEVCIMFMDFTDIVRNPIVKKILQAYENEQ